MIRHTAYSGPFTPVKGYPIVFKEHQLAHYWCRGAGLEIGAAAHNPFNLPGALNVDIDEAEHRARMCLIQAELCGYYAEIDIAAFTEDLPVADCSQDYVLSSHVLEHLWDPVTALREWQRVLWVDGVIFCIVPLPDALPADRGQPVTPVAELLARVDAEPPPPDYEQHRSIFTIDSLWDLVDQLGLPWVMVDYEPIDTKVGNGQTVVWQKIR